MAYKKITGLNDTTVVRSNLMRNTDGRIYVSATNGLRAINVDETYTTMAVNGNFNPGFITTPIVILPGWFKPTLGLFNQHTGNKVYELKDHLGNVRAVITDRKFIKNKTTFIAELVTASDYYAFGAQLYGRKYISQAGSYRYGFNGKEKDDELKGDGNSYDFGARIYDSRLGRWLSLDPLQAKYPGMSPYNFCGNNPIIFVDYDGKDYELVVNHTATGGTITIKATIYTIAGSSETEANVAKAFWMGQNGKFQYEVTDNNGKKLMYDIEFQIDVIVKNTEQEAWDKANTDPIGNSFIETGGKMVLENSRGEAQQGEFIYLDPVLKKTYTGAHELGHIFGMKHMGFLKNIMADGNTGLTYIIPIVTELNFAKIIGKCMPISPEQREEVKDSETDMDGYVYWGSHVNNNDPSLAPANFDTGKVVEKLSKGQ